MISSKASYVILTPVHNEANNIRKTLDSVVSQTIKAQQWIIINDCSTDETPEIVRSYLLENPWIILVDSRLQKGRERGGRIAKVVLEGEKHISVNYDFLVKLDGDLSLPLDYFERIFQKFLENPKLGIAGGVIHVPNNGGWRLEKTPMDHVRGATKIYREACLKEIGGIEPVNGWDGIDEWRAQLAGWETSSFPDIPLYQHRPTGGAENGLRAHVLGGEFAYFLGYPWFFTLARSIYWSFKERPYIVSGVAQFWGYISSLLRREDRFDDPILLEYIRRKQINRMAFWRKP
jgi:glycosyltransferase involved in cell wall biosynthesis